MPPRSHRFTTTAICCDTLAKTPGDGLAPAERSGGSARPRAPTVGKAPRWSENR